MSIDMNINEMFSERNQELFFNKLIMDLENNMDTFNLATKYIITIEIAKLLSSLKRIYDKYSVEIEDDKIKEFLSRTKTNLLESVGIAVSDKYSTNKKYVRDSEGRPINRTYLKDYHGHIDESERSFEDTLSLAVKEETEVNLYETLVSLYPSKNEEMHFDVLSAVNKDFTGNLLTRIQRESKHRNMTLKNMSEETYHKYLELHKKSSGSQESVKKKIKKDKKA